MNPLWRSLDYYFTSRRINIGKKYFGDDILDIGCGDATITKLLEKHIHYFGIDCDARLINILKNRFKMTGYEFIITDLEKDRLPLEHKFDTILMLAFIEHVTNTENVLNECYRLLKNNGVLVITTPTALGDRMLRILFSIASPFSNIKVDRPHKHLYNQSDLRASLESSGFIWEHYQKFEFGSNQLCIARKKE